ncbi:hypothetical protein [Streptomyces sp. BBFR2]|uniref:hypothetical protein n=1 Tax=Streptomyces sp. BBFR2 TaxID=3372854 RepID=UPI0037D9AEE9
MTETGEAPDDGPAHHGGVRLTRRGRLTLGVLAAAAAAALAAVLVSAADPFGTDGARRAAPGVSRPPRAAPAPSPTTPVVLDWQVHHERKLRAWPAVPTTYATVVHDDGDASYRRRGSRIVEYVVPGDDSNRLRLTTYAHRPRTLAAWGAQEAARLRQFWPDAEVRTAPARFQGRPALLLDATYTFSPQTPTRTRRLQLLTTAATGRAYDLYVEMPRLPAAEHTGRAVFRGARDRLRLDGGPARP